MGVILRFPKAYNVVLVGTDSNCAPALKTSLALTKLGPVLVTFMVSKNSKFPLMFISPINLKGV